MRESVVSSILTKILLFGQGLDAKQKRAAISALVDTMRYIVTPSGFGYKRSEQWFVKKCGDTSFCFSMGMDVSPLTISLRPAVWIRNERVEDLYHRVSGDNDEVKVGTVTVLWQWAMETLRYHPKQIHITRPSHVRPAARRLEVFWSDVAERFFGAHGDVKAIDTSFNDGRRILKTRFFADWFPLLAKATIVAKLAARPDYELVKEDYRLALHKHPSCHPEPDRAFQELVRLLEQ
jgi:hypothetical protein